jgi:DNA-binding Lrp family transcriptional regulator
MEAHFVYGPYDIIAKIQADISGRLRDVLTSTIRRLGQVQSTLTLIVTEEQVPGFSQME